MNHAVVTGNSAFFLHCGSVETPVIITVDLTGYIRLRGETLGNNIVSPACNFKRNAYRYCTLNLLIGLYLGELGIEEGIEVANYSQIFGILIFGEDVLEFANVAEVFERFNTCHLIQRVANSNRNGIVYITLVTVVIFATVILGDIYFDL